VVWAGEKVKIFWKNVEKFGKMWNFLEKSRRFFADSRRAGIRNWVCFA